MTAERWRQIESLFVEAVERTSAEREIFLERVCQGDDALRRELDSLLSCDTPDRRLVEIPASLEADETQNRESDADLAGRHIGPYRLERLIGRGGMGAVYLGVRDDDHYQKQVAIKLLKRGMDTDFMLSRFRQERQILANLEHPFIARLLDGGATGDGRPYLVMEFVDGVPINDYCSQKALSLPERLRIFRLVCEAVQHAHQNLVVHRDIKPSNILTTKEGVPKLLDFGIAKVLDSGVSLGETLTRRDLRMLTPDYASPEQVKGLPISTASDIYSLGAVLYELLCGHGPHRFASGSITEMERVICEMDPEKPSLAAGKSLRRRLSGDVDNIVLTAMRKEPQRRYASAAEFSEDLRRHLEAMPVHARDDRWTYRAGKFVRRNRLAVAAAVLVFASLAGGIVATTIQAHRAERRFELARRMARVVVDNVTGPMGTLPGSTAIRASMIQSILPYLDGLAEDPGRDPAFELEIAHAYQQVAGVEAHPYRQNLGQTAPALLHYEKAIAIYTRLIGRPTTRVAALGGLVSANIEAGDIETRLGNVAAASARLERVAALALEAARRDSAAVHPDTWAYLYFRLSTAAYRRGAFDEAVQYSRKAVEICRDWASRDRGVNARGTLRGAYSKLGDALVNVGDLDGARAYFELALSSSVESLRLPDVTVHERSMLSAAHRDLANLLGNPEEVNFGDSAAAISHAREAVDVSAAISASDRQDVRAKDDEAGAHRSLGEILSRERPAEALLSYRRAAALAKDLAAVEPSNTKYRQNHAFARIGVGESLHRLGKNQEALQNLIPALEMVNTLTPASDMISVLGAPCRIHRGIGDVLLADGDENGALKHYRLALATSDDLLRRYPASVFLQLHRANSLESLGRYYAMLARRRRELKTEARVWLQKSLDLWQDWTRRNVAAPYAGVRLRQATTMLASVDRI
jgi:eukaryotic-like serine/threonine-protein kinase